MVCDIGGSYDDVGAMKIKLLFCIIKSRYHLQERPYQDDSTASRLLSEVKHLRAWLVLRWGTTLEYRVLFFLPFLPDFLQHIGENK